LIIVQLLDARFDLHSRIPDLIAIDNETEMAEMSPGDVHVAIKM